MKRDIPISKQATLWRANGRWFQRRDAAYYAIAKDLLLRRYPRWLDDENIEERADVDGFECVGDVHAKADGIVDWRARRDRRVMLLWDNRGQHFDVFRWQRIIRRLARFLMFVDDCRADRDREIVEFAKRFAAGDVPANWIAAAPCTLDGALRALARANGGQNAEG